MCEEVKLFVTKRKKQYKTKLSFYIGCVFESSERIQNFACTIMRYLNRCFVCVLSNKNSVFFKIYGRQSRIKTSSGPESSFNWRPPSYPQKYMSVHGRAEFFSRGEQNHQHHKNTTIFRRAAGANENFCVFFATF